MATAKEKREYIAGFAQRYGACQIKEEGKNSGNFLEQLLTDNGRYTASGWKSGVPWCAAFVSAMAYFTDKVLGQSPKSKYNSVGSQHGGAGKYSSNVKDARIGLAVSWKNTFNNEGHVEIVVGVSDSGITTVGGNTTAFLNEGGKQVREGDCSGIHKKSWNDVLYPAKDRQFVAYYKIWDEDNSTLGEPSGQPKEEFAGKLGEAESGATSSEIQDQSVSEAETLALFKQISDSILTGESATNSVDKPKTAKETKLNTDYEAKQIADNKVQKDKINIVLQDTTKQEQT